MFSKQSLQKQLSLLELQRQGQRNPTYKPHDLLLSEVNATMSVYVSASNFSAEALKLALMQFVPFQIYLRNQPPAHIFCFRLRTISWGNVKPVLHLASKQSSPELVERCNLTLSCQPSGGGIPINSRHFELRVLTLCHTSTTKTTQDCRVPRC